MGKTQKKTLQLLILKKKLKTNNRAFLTPQFALIKALPDI